MTNDPLTDKERAAVKMAIDALVDTIREIGSIPAGHLYAAVMNYFTLSQFEAIIGVLVEQKRVRRDRSHLLTWIGDSK